MELKNAYFFKPIRMIYFFALISYQAHGGGFKQTRNLPSSPQSKWKSRKTEMAIATFKKG